MPAISRRNLLLAAALVATLVAAWFAPEDPGSDLAVSRGRDPAAGRATAPAGAPATGTAASATGAAGAVTAAATEAQRRDAEEDRRRALAALDVDQIRKRDGAKEADDAFTRKSWYVAPPPKPAPPPPVFVPPPPPPPVVPQAPPLPFKHLGRVTESGKNRPVHYLLEGERMLTVSEGDVIAGKYRFVGQIGNQLQFIYLPLDTRQSLPIAGTP